MRNVGLGWVYQQLRSPRLDVTALPRKVIFTETEIIRERFYHHWPSKFSQHSLVGNQHNVLRCGSPSPISRDLGLMLLTQTIYSRLSLPPRSSLLLLPHLKHKPRLTVVMFARRMKSVVAPVTRVLPGKLNALCSAICRVC